MTRAVKPARKARGRPRSEEAKQSILKAARLLLAEGGPGALTIEAVAALAGVGKPTIYRWWPDRHAVMMTALMESDGVAVASPRRQSALDELREQLCTTARRLSTKTGRHVTSLIATAERESELSKAFRSHFVLARRAEGRALLERAIAAKEIREDLHLEVALDQLYGPLFFRLLIGHAPLDEAFMDMLLQQALRGLSVSSSGKARGRRRGDAP